MSKEIFRKKTVDKLTAPEDLHKFIKIANPGVWVLILAIICFLTGVLVWGFVGRLEMKAVSCTQTIRDDRIIHTFISFTDAKKIKKDQIIRVGNKEYTISAIVSEEPAELKDVIASDVQRRKIASQLGWNENELVIQVDSYTDTPQTETEYLPSNVITGSVPPLTYVFNI